MRRRVINKIRNQLIVFTVFLAAFAANFYHCVFAEGTDTLDSTAENADDISAGTSGTHIGISPVSQTFELYSDSVYEKDFVVTNGGSNDMEIEVYTTPYSYTYSSEQDSYQLGFNQETNFTQIARWITFKDLGGNYVEKTKFTIAPNSSLTVNYRITTPSSIPAGGQYAVIFARTLTGAKDVNSGVITEAAPGIVIYGRSMEGKTISASEVKDLKIVRKEALGGNGEGNSQKAGYYASGVVKNTGNVDVTATGILTVTSLFGEKIYETEMMGNSTVSVIPESEREVEDIWSDLPGFGVYNLSWTITAGDSTETVTSVAFINIIPAIIIAILLLTFIIFWIIIMLRKRKERRSRLAI